MTIADCLNEPKIKELYDMYQSWDWNYGYTPKFTNEMEAKFPWAMVDLNLKVERGLIVDGRVWSDCLSIEFIDIMNQCLLNIPYDIEGM